MSEDRANRSATGDWVTGGNAPHAIMPAMSDAQGADEAAQLINRQLGRLKAGSLRFWGHWFGRPYDNVHTVIGAGVEGDVLFVRFDEDELLTVWEPRGYRFDDTAFVILAADRVRWEWFYYGRAKTRENLFFEELQTRGATLVPSTNVDWYTPEFDTDASLPAVEMF